MEGHRGALLSAGPADDMAFGRSATIRPQPGIHFSGNVSRSLSERPPLHFHSEDCGTTAGDRPERATSTLPEESQRRLNCVRHSILPDASDPHHTVSARTRACYVHRY